MRALVAVTCIAVLAAVGYYFWGEYSEAQAKYERQAKINEAMSWLYALSKAEKGDVERVKQFCNSIREYGSIRERAKKLGADVACQAAGL